MSPTKLSGGHKNTDDKKEPLAKDEARKDSEQGSVSNRKGTSRKGSALPPIRKPSERKKEKD